MTPAYFLVIDLEATCADDGSIPREESEIIEVGAVMIDRMTFQAVDEFQAFVRPVIHPLLTEFCCQLTNIQQSDVAHAAGFADVLDRLISWADHYPQHVFCSWGDYDRTQIARDCRRHGRETPFEQHINLKQRFAIDQNIRRPLGVSKALERFGLTFEGQHHRGIDDARNIARLLPFMILD